LLKWQTLYAQPITHYAPTMLQTISNPDGTVSIIHMDPNSAVVTLPDGTQAQVRAVSALRVSLILSLLIGFELNIEC
jgi:hypothetical protein